MAHSIDTKERRMAMGTLWENFAYLPDKEQAWKDLLFNLLVSTKENNSFHQKKAIAILVAVFPNVTDKEQATKDLLALAKDADSLVRKNAAYLLSSVARYYIQEKDFKKASRCFSGATSASRFGWLQRIKPEPDFYLYEGFGSYYRGRALVSELPEKKPEAYVKTIKEAVSFFNKSINYINKSGRREYEDEIRFFPICLNIYSALYEYNLSYLNFDKKRISKVNNYLDTASAQCKIAGTQRGEDLVKVLEKLTASLKIFLEVFEQEQEEYEATDKGKGGGWEAKYERYIDKLKKDFKESLVEVDNTLDELEAPVFKKIAAIEKETLEKLQEKLQSREPKTSWQHLYGIIKKFWKPIVAIGLILATIKGIIESWQFISDFIKKFL